MFYQPLYCCEYYPQQPRLNDVTNEYEYIIEVGMFASFPADTAILSADTLQELVENYVDGQWQSITLQSFPQAYGPDKFYFAPGSWIYCVDTGDIYIYDTNWEFILQGQEGGI